MKDRKAETLRPHPRVTPKEIFPMQPFFRRALVAPQSVSRRRDMKWYQVIPGLFLTLCSPPALADMAKGVARSAGSFFAAAISCEERDKITRGQTAALLAELDRHLSPGDTRQIRHGFASGSQRASVFIPKTGWTPFSPDDDGCFRVQGVLDDYKMRLNEQ